MCGRYNVADNALMRALAKSLRLDHFPEPRKNIAPGAKGQFVYEHDGVRSLVDGYWSLLIEPKPEDHPGYRPNPRFKTFNARSDRLLSSPLWRGRIHQKRAIIPATGYHEWVGKQCYQIEQLEQSIAFAGMYELWEFRDELVPAYTIITLQEHPRLAHIHDTMPMLLTEKNFDVWLDPTFTQIEVLHDLMRPYLHHPLRVIPVSSPATLIPAGEDQLIAKDVSA